MPLRRRTREKSMEKPETPRTTETAEHQRRFEEAVSHALRKKPPPEGWPDKPTYGKRGRPKRDGGDR